MDGEVQIRFPSQFSHSVKIEQTAKGARISVHVYSNSQDEAIGQAVQIYGAVRERLEREGHAVAPIETESRSDQSLAA
jgi:hypothetical protein